MAKQFDIAGPRNSILYIYDINLIINGLERMTLKMLAMGKLNRVRLLHPTYDS
jgi:hypothetical protein